MGKHEIGSTLVRFLKVHPAKFPITTQSSMMIHAEAE